MREIHRIAEQRDQLERRQRRIDHALAHAIAMLRERPEDARPGYWGFNY
jgi:hypothetical protein